LRRREKPLRRAGGRRCRLPRHEHRDPLKLGDLPRRLHAARRFVGAQADARKQRVDVESRLAHHFGDRRCVGTIWSGAVLCGGTGRRGECDQHSGCRRDRAESDCEFSTLDPERQRARRVEHHDLGRGRSIGEWPQEIEQTHALDRDIAVAIELRVDRDEIVVALELERVAVVVDERDRVGPCGIHLGEEFAEQTPHVARVDVGALDDLEADAGQGLRDKAAIGERRGDRALRVGGISDDQRDTLLGRCRQRKQKERRRNGEPGQNSAQHFFVLASYRPRLETARTL
jgi:hypothetical protein